MGKVSIEMEMANGNAICARTERDIRSDKNQLAVDEIQMQFICTSVTTIYDRMQLSGALTHFRFASIFNSFVPQIPSKCIH